MATLYNRTIGTITDSGDTLTLRLICTYTQTAQNNTSAVSIYVRAECSANDWPYKVSSWQITGNSITGSGGETTATTGTRNMTTKSKTITHSTSGNYSFSSGAKVTVIYWDSAAGNWATKSFTLSNASYQPATIDVYSSLAFSPSPATMGSNVTMTITKKSSSAFTATGVKITAEYDGTSVDVYEGTAASKTWSVPDLATTTTDSTSKTLTIKIQSTRSGVYYAAKEYTLTANVPSTYVPGITIGTVTDNIGWSSFVSGYSKLTIPLTGSVSSDGGATITGYSVTVRDTNSSGAVLYNASATTSSASQSFTMNVPIASTSTHITAIVTDSRGRTKTATKSVSAAAYSQPQISLAANRCNSGGTSDPLGAYVKITVTWSITQIGTSNTVNGNVITYKSTNGTSYSSADSRTVSGYSGSYSFVTSLATTTQGWFYTTIKDKVSAQVTSAIKMVPKAVLPLSLFDNGSNVGIAFGQMASEAGTHHHIKDVYYNTTPIEYRNGGTTYTRNNLLDLIFPVGYIYLSVNNTNPGTFLGGTWAQIKDRFLLAAGDTYTNGATGGEATHTLTETEMPSHTHEYTTNNRGSGSNQAGRAYYGTNGGSTWQIQTTATGGGGAHNNMPPYLVVYMWKRTA